MNIDIRVPLADLSSDPKIAGMQIISTPVYEGLRAEAGDIRKDLDGLDGSRAQIAAIADAAVRSVDRSHDALWGRSTASPSDAMGDAADAALRAAEEAERLAAAASQIAARLRGVAWAAQQAGALLGRGPA